MDEEALRRLLEAVQVGAVTTDDAVDRLRHLPFADLGFARVDHHRALRQGMAEAVYGPGKTPEQCAEIVAELLAAPGDSPVLLTRANDQQVATTLSRNPDGLRTGPGPGADLSTVAWRPAAPRAERVVIATAGTADLPVSEECSAVLSAHGVDPIRLTDAATILRCLQCQKQPRLTLRWPGFFRRGRGNRRSGRSLRNKRSKLEGRHKPLGALPRSERLLFALWHRDGRPELALCSGR